MQYGLIGEKLGHSFSKTVHSMLANYDYTLCEVSRDDFDDFMTKKDFCAVNVTIPYKRAVIPYLDFIDKAAQEIGAVNTVVNKDGKLYGYNTDCLGMLALIEKNGIEIKGKRVAILGTGGTSKTANAVCKSLSAKEILIVSRTEKEGVITYDALKKNYADTDVIINTTPLGMYPDTESQAITIDSFTKLSAVIDVIYNPINTRLLISAKKRNIKAAGGLYMLVAQAAYAVEKFIDKKIDKSDIDGVYNKILSEKENIVLIGMPSCGKSTIGKMVAEKTGKEFIDTDAEIVKRANTPISEIFEMQGEEFFRNLEEEVIEDIARFNGKVIATGGGAILRESNTDRLKRNGIVIFIDRPLEYLKPTSDRPLSKDFALLERRYGERYAKYLAACDIRLNTTQTKTENRDNLISLINEYNNNI